MNKKGFMTPVDIVGSICIIVLLAIYIVYMVLVGATSGIDKIDAIETSSDSNLNLYSYLESPVEGGKMVDLLRDYVESDFSNDELKVKIEDETKLIFKNLKFCNGDEEFHNLVVLEDESNFEIIYKDYSILEKINPIPTREIIGNLLGGNSQRIPYNNGVFYVWYSGRNNDKQTKDCEGISFE